MPDKEKKVDPMEKQAPVIMTLADITSWDIGPGKESDSQLTIKVTVKNWEDVRVVRALATGPIVLRIMPLQFRLPTGSEGCDHPAELQIRFSLTQSVCLNCGVVQEVAGDERVVNKPHPFEAGPAANVCQECGQSQFADLHRDQPPAE